MTTELKPCPFCGGPGKLSYKSGSYGYYSGSWYAECPSCAVKTKGFDDEAYDTKRGHYSVAEEALDSAIRVWNRRAA